MSQMAVTALSLRHDDAVAGGDAHAFEGDDAAARQPICPSAAVAMPGVGYRVQEAGDALCRPPVCGHGSALRRRLENEALCRVQIPPLMVAVRRRGGV